MSNAESVVVPSSPEDLKNLRKSVEELVNSMIRESSEKSYQTESIKQLSEKYGIPKGMLKRMAKENLADSFGKKSNEQEEYENLYEAVWGAK